jgi:hybrid cluster-associated redox disulfide protein
LINRVMVINKNSTIKEILSAYPEAKKFFNEREMACSSCFAVNFDTLEKGALMHGLDAKTLVDELKNFLKTFPTPIAFLQQK